MIIDRYIGRNVIYGSLLTLFLLTSLIAFIHFVKEMQDVGKASYGVLDALAFVALGYPKDLYELFPTAVLLGSMLGLGSMASNSELTVIRTAGLSVARIVRSVIQAGLILALLVAIIGEVVVPETERMAQEIRASALQQKITLGGQQGLWARDGDYFLHADNVYPGFHLAGIKLYQVDDNGNIKAISHVASAHYRNKKWILNQVSTSLVDDKGIRVEKIPRETWDRLLNPDLLDVVSVKPQNMSAIELYRYSHYLQQNDLDASQYKLAFWIKIMTPLSSVVMLLIALPFVFGSQRSTSAGHRLMMGLLLGIGFYVLNKTLNHMGQVYGFDPFMSAAIPVFVVAIFALLGLRKIH